MDINEIRTLAEMNVEETAVEGYDILFGRVIVDENAEEHKKSSIESVLMPMIQKHKDMATELLDIREGLDRIAAKLEDVINVAKPQQQEL